MGETLKAYPCKANTYRIVDTEGNYLGFYTTYVDHSIQVMHLYHIEVFPAYRNHGYGTTIVRSLLKTVQDLGFKALYAHVDADNPDAQHFFEKFGTMEQTMGWDGRYLVTLYKDTCSN